MDLMNEIIKAAAEASTNHPASQNIYKASVTHFLSHLKANGYEVVRVGDDVQDIIGEELSMFGPYEKHSSSVELTYYSEAIDGINKAYAIAAAKERERMKGVMENASEEGWEFEQKKEVWFMYDRVKDETFYKTTDELINHYQNKEV